MRISQLSERSGVAVATIKFYSREGLLPAALRPGPTRTDYSDVHLDRIRLIRALLEAGGLSIAAVKRVIAAIDDPEMPLDHAFGIAQSAIPATRGERGDADLGGQGAERVAELIADRGWQVYAENPGIALAARTIDAYHSIGRGDLLRSLPAYARAAEMIAAADLDAVAAAPDRDRMTETVVVGTVLGDAMIAALRRIAQEHRSHRAFPVDGSGPGPAEPPRARPRAAEPTRTEEHPS